MGQGSLLLRALHEHRNRRPNALIDEHHENLVLVAKENRAAAAHRESAKKSGVKPPCGSGSCVGGCDLNFG
jgi:hypothetical protein